MKKVGILSMQRIANYGSFLQAYGLKSMLEELGCQVEFVDYHPGRTLIPPAGGSGLKRKIAKVLETFKYRAPFKEKLRFIRYKKNYAENYYPLLGISEERNYAPKLDLLVIGSDEVFNCVQNNTNVGFSPELFGAGSCAERTISYAASFGNTTKEKLEEHKVAEDVAKWLKELDAVSVRDENSGSIVRELTGGAVEYHLDPVLIYDFVGACRDVHTTHKEKYMILYGYSGRFSREECARIKAYAKAKGYKIYNFGGVQDACDQYIDCNPFEVISYFRNAECVVTDTFHGSILSVITHRPFLAVVRKSGYGNSEKLTDLLKRLNLTDRICEQLDQLDFWMEKEMDYGQVDSFLEEEKKKSYAYLKKQVEIG